MGTLSKIGRRAFLGGSAAVVAGAGLLPRLTARGGGRAHFERTDGFPDGTFLVQATLPGAPHGARAEVTLFVETPLETLSFELDAVTLVDGRAELEVVLAYPYDERVAGDYRYHVRVELGGRRAVTTEPAEYSLRRVHWFS